MCCAQWCADGVCLLERLRWLGYLARMCVCVFSDPVACSSWPCVCLCLCCCTAVVACAVSSVCRRLCVYVCSGVCELVVLCWGVVDEGVHPWPLLHCTASRTRLSFGQCQQWPPTDCSDRVIDRPLCALRDAPDCPHSSGQVGGAEGIRREMIQSEGLYMCEWLSYGIVRMSKYVKFCDSVRVHR